VIPRKKSTSICAACGLVTPEPCRDDEEAQSCPHAPGAAFTEGPLVGLKKWHYGAILADPPWSFMTRSDKGKDRSPETHYDCMSLDEIKALPVGELAAKDCALFMWTIDTHLAMALDVIAAWGFTYKTRAFCWAKTNKEPGPALDDATWFKGMGFWTRANPEDCWLATKGAPKRQSKAVRRLIVAQRREHSRKPDETYERIEALVPGPYCELFARTNRAGWDQMGNEVGKFSPAAHGEDPELAALMKELI
jgi:N6-adenosine-specific RNA methylase IME4